MLIMLMLMEAMRLSYKIFLDGRMSVPYHSFIMEERSRTIKTVEKTIAAFLLKVSGDSMAGEGIM